jgi:hypothetical protein
MDSHDWCADANCPMCLERFAASHFDVAPTGDLIRMTREITEANLLLQHVRQLAIEADSELSAIAHGRPPSDRETLLRLAHSFRELYEKRIRQRV